ncbi:MAG: recombinase family protein [Candidatus Bathyarchaeia archaeon]
MKNAVAYARVSTKEHVETRLSIPAQLKAIRGYALPHGFRILESTLMKESQPRQVIDQLLRR